MGLWRCCAFSFLFVLVTLLFDVGRSKEGGASSNRTDVYSFFKKSDVLDVKKELTRAYEFFHRNPELGKKEFKTQKYLLEKLRATGNFRFVDSKLAPTAVIAILKGNRKGPTIALRADMDARPGSEDLSHIPRSQIDGIMHSCGHDIHTSILLASALLMSRNLARLKGKVVFLFQPAEEIKGGADDIVKEGILEDENVEKIFALHVVPKLEVGTVTLSRGYSMAGSNYFSYLLKEKNSNNQNSDLLNVGSKIVQELYELPKRLGRKMVITPSKIFGAFPTGRCPPEAKCPAFSIRLKGKGSHAAIPEEGSNLPYVGSRLVQKLRIKHPRLRISHFSNCGGEGRPSCQKGKNVIHNSISISGVWEGYRAGSEKSVNEAVVELIRPELPPGVVAVAQTKEMAKVKEASFGFGGTIRAFEEIDQGPEGEESIRGAVEKLIAGNLSLNIRMERGPKYYLKKGAPPTLNHGALFDEITPRLKEVFSGHLDLSEIKAMFSEDFSYYTQVMPAAYFGLGVMKDGLGRHGVHTNKFTAHPDSFHYGLALMLNLIFLANFSAL